MSEISSFDSASIDDGRGRYPDRIAASVSKALGKVARGVAAEQGISVAELARRALINAVAKPNAAPLRAATVDPLTDRSTHENFEGPTNV